VINYINKLLEEFDVRLKGVKLTNLEVLENFKKKVEYENFILGIIEETELQLKQLGFSKQMSDEILSEVLVIFSEKSKKIFELKNRSISNFVKVCLGKAIYNYLIVEREKRKNEVTFNTKTCSTYCTIPENRIENKLLLIDLIKALDSLSMDEKMIIKQNFGFEIEEGYIPKNNFFQIQEAGLEKLKNMIL
jgi:hypothetical protein